MTSVENGVEVFVERLEIERAFRVSFEPRKEGGYKGCCNQLTDQVFEGKTLEEVRGKVEHAIGERVEELKKTYQTAVDLERIGWEVDVHSTGSVSATRPIQKATLELSRSMYAEYLRKPLWRRLLGELGYKVSFQPSKA